jgi:AcrR family transcriptional regulator
MAKVQAMARREPEPRREQVLRVAEALFARAGYRGAGLREIAAQVGIRAPSLFKHFRSKQALYNAVLLNIFSRLTDVAECLEGEAPFTARLEEFIGGYVDLVADDPHVVPLLFRELMERFEAMHPETRSAALEIYRRVDVFLEAGQNAGAFRQVDRFRFQIALTGAILYHGLAAKPYQTALRDRVGPPDRAAWKRTVLDLARGALLPR